ncbi:MAG: amidohydrolase [Clostridia bacterium]|nr:amidohydrolase [Clostridia bacterium]
MNKYLAEAQAMFPQLQKDQQAIHQFGGVGYDLRESADYILAELKAMGVEAKEIIDCGIVATIGKGNGKTVLIRADFDALPQEEQTGLPYAATNGSCHSCGHDHHASMLLGTARMLKAHEDEIEGTVKLMFQPDEESVTGCAAMIKAGVLENPKVDVSFATHIEAGTDRDEVGKVIWSTGVTYSSSDRFEVTFKGEGGHGAQPHVTKDPITAMCQAVTSAQHIISMEVPAKERAVITFGQIHSGTVFNIIPSEAHVSGTIRTYSSEVRELCTRRFKEIMEGTAKMMNCETKVEYQNSVDCVVNNRELAIEMKPWVQEICGDNYFTSDEPLSFGSEDYCWIANAVPSVIMTLGAGTPANGYNYTAHNPHIHFDPNCMPYGVATFVNLAINWLKAHK